MNRAHPPQMAPALDRAARAAPRGRRPGGENTSRVSGPSNRLLAQWTLSQPGDALERDADRVADSVLRMATPPDRAPAAPAVASGLVQRRCAACAEEDRIHRQALGLATLSAQPGHAPVPGRGAPLAAAERAFFEPRFGASLAHVRVHEGDTARRFARACSARAYTFGRDIVLGEAPTRALLAHELAHVLQQPRDGAADVRRLAYGTGTPPTWAGRTLAVVPAEDRSQVDAAIARVDEVVNNPDRYIECHRHFAERCPSGNTGTLAAVWGRARLWKLTSPEPGTLARGDVGGADLAYTREGYDQGTYGLAQTLMHEAGHNCGIPGGSTHWRAEAIATYCMGAGRTELSLAFGRYLGRDGMLLMYSYRRFLGDWASGRARATLGADFNLLGVANEAAGPGASGRPAGEFGSVMAGVQGRLEGEGPRPSGGWGGPRFGGVTVRVETGIGVGRFSLRPADPGEARSAIAPSWVLQVGPRAEFLIPVGSAYVMPVSIGAALRLAVPLNPDAEQLTSGLISLEGRF